MEKINPKFIIFWSLIILSILLFSVGDILYNYNANNVHITWILIGFSGICAFCSLFLCVSCDNR